MNEALQLLNQQAFCTLSTSDADGNPWGSPVFFALAPDASAIYWWSAQDSIHSQNIDTNGQVFITAFNSTSSESDAQGAYILATAAVIEDPAEFAQAAATYNAKANVFKLDANNALGNAPSRMYAATPHLCWVNDETTQDGQYVDIRRQVS